jgi:hypothetical protein
MPIIYWVEQYYTDYSSWISDGEFLRSREEASQNLLRLKERNNEFSPMRIDEYRVQAAYLTMEAAIQGGYARKDETIWYRNNDEHNSVMSEVA